MNDIMNDIKFKIGDKVVKKNTRDCFVQTIIYIQYPTGLEPEYILYDPYSKIPVSINELTLKELYRIIDNKKEEFQFLINIK